VKAQVNEMRSDDELEGPVGFDRREERYKVVETRSTKETSCDGRRCEEVEVNDVGSKKDGLISRAVHCPPALFQCPSPVWTGNNVAVEKQKGTGRRGLLGRRLEAGALERCSVQPARREGKWSISAAAQRPRWRERGTAA
jgi:hypothetical protein